MRHVLGLHCRKHRTIELLIVSRHVRTAALFLKTMVCDAAPRKRSDFRSFETEVLWESASLIGVLKVLDIGEALCSTN